MPIAPWVLPAAGIGGALLLISSAGKGEVEDVPSGSEPALQSIRRAHPETGQPIQIVVPVTTAMPQISESVVPIAGPVRDNHGAGARYVPRPVLVRRPNNSNILRLAPMVITPHGASTLAVETMSDVQNALNTMGFGPLAVTGKFNPRTSMGVNTFQRAHGYLATGAVDGQTMSQLQDALAHLAGTQSFVGAHPEVQQAVSPVAPIPGSGAQIASILDVQHALNLLGASPSLVEDGHDGPKTTAAVVAFQIVHGLTGDGKPGPMTKAALGQALASPGGASMHGDPMAVDPMIRDYDFWTAPNSIRMAYDPATLLPIRSVVDVQAALVNLGWPSLPVTGQLDSASKSAVRTLQAKYGLSADGIPGPKTRALVARLLAQAKTNAQDPGGAAMAGDFFHYGTGWPYGAAGRGGDFGKGHSHKKKHHHRPQPPPPPSDDADMGAEFGSDFGIGVVIPSQYGRPPSVSDMGCSMGFGAESGPALLPVPASPANGPLGLPNPRATLPHGMTSPVPPSLTHIASVVSGSPKAAHGDFSSNPAPNSTSPLIGVVSAPGAVSPVTVHPAAAASAGLSNLPPGASAPVVTAANLPPSAASMQNIGAMAAPPSAALSAAAAGGAHPLAPPPIQTMPNLSVGLPGSLGAAPALAVNVPAFPGEEIPGDPSPWYPVPVTEPTVDFGVGYGMVNPGMGSMHHPHRHRHHHHRHPQSMMQPQPPMDDGGDGDDGGDMGFGFERRPNPPMARGVFARPLPPGVGYPGVYGHTDPYRHHEFPRHFGPGAFDHRFAERARLHALEAARLSRMRMLAQMQAQSTDDAAAQQAMLDQGGAMPLVQPQDGGDDASAPDDGDDAGADTGFGFDGMESHYPHHHFPGMGMGPGGPGGIQGGMGPGGVRPNPRALNTWQRWQQIHPGTPYSDYQNWWNTFGQQGAQINGEHAKPGSSRRASSGRAFG